MATPMFRASLPKVATLIKLYTQRLVRADGSFDRGAIMAKAWREMHMRRRYGEETGFAACLAYAWRVARDQRALSTKRRMAA